MLVFNDSQPAASRRENAARATDLGVLEYTWGHRQSINFYIILNEDI